MNKYFVKHMVNNIVNFIIWFGALALVFITLTLLIGATCISCKSMDKTAMDEVKNVHCPGILESAKIAEVAGIPLTAGEKQLVKECE